MSDKLNTDSYSAIATIPLHIQWQGERLCFLGYEQQPNIHGAPYRVRFGVFNANGSTTIKMQRWIFPHTLIDWQAIEADNSAKPAQYRPSKLAMKLRATKNHAKGQTYRRALFLDRLKHDAFIAEMQSWDKEE